MRKREVERGVRKEGSHVDNLGKIFNWYGWASDVRWGRECRHVSKFSVKLCMLFVVLSSFHAFGLAIKITSSG